MMKFFLFLIFSFGTMKCCFEYLYLITFILLFMMVYNVNLMFNLWVMIYSIFSMDFYSFYLVLLTILIISVCLLIKMNRFSVLMILILLMILIMSFCTFNLLMFYFLFEVSLLPIFMLILFDGYTYERFEASYYMFFYTMISSMPFFLFILMMMSNLKTLMFMILEMQMYYLRYYIFMMMMLVFFVKMPMFLVHIWLPKAHVEAPVYGSMILAGILLKLGSYGILRMSQLFPMNMMIYNKYYIVISLFGGLMMSLVCLIQIDMKMLVAYSSVVHMSMLIASMSTLSKIGFIGSYFMMIGHGLCSSGLFYIVNISYQQMGSRLLYFNKGLINLNSSLSMWWFLLCVGNFSAPISLSLIGEILMLTSLLFFDLGIMFILMFMCFFSAAYSLYLYSITQHGNLNFLFMKFYIVSVKDYLILFIHWFYLNFLTLSLNLFMI